MTNNGVEINSSGGGTMDPRVEVEQTLLSLHEIDIKIEQSQGELAKLAQRNSNITVELQQAQAKIDKISKAELRAVYDSALDVQQRMLLMRGQLEKLQNDRNHLQKLKAVLENTSPHNKKLTIGDPSSEKVGSAGVEMLVNVQESERQRLSRQMHDGPAQALSNFILQTEIAARLLDVDPVQAREELSNLKIAAMGTFQMIRNFIFELRPMMLDDLGLAPTLRKYISAFHEQTGLDVNLAVTGTERRLEPYIEIMIFRAIQELIGNAVRHGQATTIRVLMDLNDHSCRITVDDNGKGADLEALGRNGSLGLKLIKERVEMLGGTFEIDSAAGKGTRVVFSLPINNPTEELK